MTIEKFTAHKCKTYFRYSGGTRIVPGIILGRYNKAQTNIVFVKHKDVEHFIFNSLENYFSSWNFSKYCLVHDSIKNRTFSNGGIIHRCDNDIFEREEVIISFNDYSGEIKVIETNSTNEKIMSEKSLKEELEDAFSHLNPSMPMDKITQAGIANVETDNGLKKNVFVVGKDAVADTILLFDPKGSSIHKEFIHDHPHVTYFIDNIKGVSFTKEEGSFIFASAKFVKNFKPAPVTYNSTTKTFDAIINSGKSKYSLKDLNQSGFVSYKLLDKTYTGGILLGASDRYLLIHGECDNPSNKTANYNSSLNNSLEIKTKFLDFPEDVQSTIKGRDFLWLSPENITEFIPTTITCAKDEIKFTAHPDKVEEEGDKPKGITEEEINEAGLIDFNIGSKKFDNGLVLGKSLSSDKLLIYHQRFNNRKLSENVTFFAGIKCDKNNPLYSTGVKYGGYELISTRDLKNFRPKLITYLTDESTFEIKEKPSFEDINESGLVDIQIGNEEFLNGFLIGKSDETGNFLIYHESFTKKSLPLSGHYTYYVNIPTHPTKFSNGGFVEIKPQEILNFTPKIVTCADDSYEFKYRSKYTLEEINTTGYVEHRVGDKKYICNLVVGKNDKNVLIVGGNDEHGVDRFSDGWSDTLEKFLDIPSDIKLKSEGKKFFWVPPEDITLFSPEKITCHLDENNKLEFFRHFTPPESTEKGHYKLEEINSTGHVEYELDGVNYIGHLLGKDNDSVFILGRNDTYGSKQFVGSSFDDGKFFTNIPSGIDVANEKFRFFWLLFDKVRLFSPEKLTCELTKDSKLDIVRHFTPVESTEKGNYKFDDINSTGRIEYVLDGKKCTQGLVLGKDDFDNRILILGERNNISIGSFIGVWTNMSDMFIDVPQDIEIEQFENRGLFWLDTENITFFSPQKVTYKINKNNKLEFVYDSLIGKDKENKMTDIKDKVLGTPKEDLKKAGIAIATNTFLSTIKGPLADSIAASMPSVSKEQALSFLNSPIGEAFVGYFMAAAVNMVPLKQFESQRSEIAEHLRIKAYTDVGNSAVEIVAEPLMQALQSASVMGLLSSAEPDGNVVDTTITQGSTESDQQASTP